MNSARAGRVTAGTVSAVLLLLAGADGARACDCAPSALKASQFLQPSSRVLAGLHKDIAVFVGKVVEQSKWRDDELMTTKFRVLRTLHGNPPEILEAKGLTENSCGLDIYVAEVQLYLFWKTSDREWNARGCDQPQRDLSYRQLVEFAQSGARK
jgi:hypothetical protein